MTETTIVYLCRCKRGTKQEEQYRTGEIVGVWWCQPNLCGCACHGRQTSES